MVIGGWLVQDQVMSDLFGFHNQIQ